MVRHESIVNLLKVTPYPLKGSGFGLAYLKSHCVKVKLEKHKQEKLGLCHL